jgi:NAD(P)H-hydrate epimerase
LTREQVRELDRRAIEEYGIPSIVLMENAGRACASVAQELLAGSSAGPVLVLCGPGNNGGDGLVIARTLANRGLDARVRWVGELEALARSSADVRTNARLWTGIGQTLERVATPAELVGLEHELADAALVVDALFGTGLVRQLGQPWAAAIQLVNRSRRPVLAVDLPSGLDAESGAELGAAVRATTTVTFVAAKPGLCAGRGPELAGEVRVVEIGIPQAWICAFGKASS